MSTFFTIAGVLLLMMMVPVIFRVLVGPTTIDRIVAVNVIGTKTTVLLVIIGQIYGRVDMFVDFALAYALLNFIGSLAAARYFSKTRPAYGQAIKGGKD
jgi:multicomponent Na+:H+ antiporter subunit F